MRQQSRMNVEFRFNGIAEGVQLWLQAARVDDGRSRSWEVKEMDRISDGSWAYRARLPIGRYYYRFYTQHRGLLIYAGPHCCFDETHQLNGFLDIKDDLAERKYADLSPIAATEEKPVGTSTSAERIDRHGKTFARRTDSDDADGGEAVFPDGREYIGTQAETLWRRCRQATAAALI
jgi:hypothetical protein